MRLVAGIHNGALILVLTLGGTEFALRGIGAARAATSSGREQWARGYPTGMLLLGTVLITLSSQVKLPSLLALGFVAMALARRWGGTFKAFLIASGSLTAVSLAVIAVVGRGQGLPVRAAFPAWTSHFAPRWESPPTNPALGTRPVLTPLRRHGHTNAA